jgi:Putative prokaryotic signal transducing protein
VDDPVRLTTVADEIEAEMVCDLLRSAGLGCGHRATEAADSPLHGVTADGPQEVLVNRDDLDAARAVLAEKYKT